MSKKLEKEIRCLAALSPEMLNVEKRTDGTEEYVVEGYAVTFNQDTLIGEKEWGWIERIDPHALDETDTRDCCFKYNHGDSMGILGRTKNGSLTLTIDEKGVRVRNVLPNTVQGKDFYTLVKDGYIDKMSFAFTVADDEINDREKPVKRIIKKVGKLFDVAGVDVPAYDTTSLYARSKAMAEAKTLIEAEAAKRELEEAEASHKAEERKRFEFQKKKALTLVDLKIGGKKRE